MAKTVALNWHEFMRGNIVEKGKVGVIVRSSAGAFIVMMSAATAAAKDATFSTLLNDILGVFDWIVVGVIMFAGASWMFGNRTKAIELLLGAAIGYLIVRHAVDIRDWLRTI